MTADISFSLLNAASQTAGIFQGVAATLNVTLTNNTGGNITLTSNSAGPSSMTIFLPGFFTGPQTQAMTIALQDWTFLPDAADQRLMLTYSGPDQKAWDAGTNISFAIGNVEATAAPTSDQVQINFNNMAGNVPTQETCPISLSAQPMPGNAKLRDVLQVSLENQGTVYVSQAGDPLANTLLLNFSNIGATPLYSGTSLWTGNPQVTIEFVYGLTAGSLAQDNDRANPGVGSAWTIAGAVEVSEGNNWGVSNPSTTGQDAHPKWILTPSATNLGIIGTGDSANILFSFKQVISMTPVGTTQMIVHFSGFAKDASTLYDDAVFVLEIFKLEPPPSRGLINFYSPDSTLTVTEPDAIVPFTFYWSAFYVDSVQLYQPGSTTPLLSRNYDSQGVPPALTFDHAVAQLSYADILGHAPNPNQPVTFTLNAYDGGNNLINSKQFSVIVDGIWGGLTITATPATVLVSDPQTTLSFDIAWTTFETGNIVLTWGAGMQTTQLVSTTYTHAILKRPDHFAAQIPYLALAAALGSNQGGQITFTLSSSDVNGNFLNSITCGATITTQLFVDPRDSQVYATVKVGSTLWMAHNLNWDAGSNSMYYNNDSSMAPTYGRLYCPAALANVPPGWRLPTPQDWLTLVQAFSTQSQGQGYTDAYAVLIAGGSAGFNAQLGGYLTNQAAPIFVNLGIFGVYWSDGPPFAIFVDSSIILAFTRPTFSAGTASLRYVKDV